MNRAINRMNRQFWLAASAAAALLCGAGSASADSTEGYYISGDGGVSFLPNLHLNDAAGKQHERFDAGYAYGAPWATTPAMACASNSTLRISSRS